MRCRTTPTPPTLLLLLLALCQGARGTGLRPRIWVRRPDGGTQIELVPSLAKLCAAEGLDEEAMRAVADGEQAEHRGWTCGTVCEAMVDDDEAEHFEEDAAQTDQAVDNDQDAQSKLGSSPRVAKPKAAATKASTSRPAVSRKKSPAVARTRNVATKPAGAPKAKAAEEELAPAPPAPSLGGILGSKMVVQFAASTLASKAVKRMDQKAPDFVQKLRLIFYFLVGSRLLIEAVIGWRIAAAADDTQMASTGAADPMAAMLASMGLGAGQKDQTVMEYDKKQLAKTQMNFKISAIFVFLMHVLRNWHSTLIYSTTSSLVDILYHPLFQIHILGRKPVGPLARPFKAASPLPFAAPSGDKLSGGLGSPTAGLGGLGGLGGKLSGFAPALAAAGDATSETPKVEEKPDADEATGSAADDAE